MKTSKPIVILSLVLLIIAGFATYQLTTPIKQAGVTNGLPDSYDQVEDIRGLVGSALANGNTAVLKNHLADEVSLDLLEEGDIYFKEEVIELLEKFFAAYPTESYQEKHRGSSGSGEEQYLVGELKTVSGNFRTYILTKNAKIVELKISED